MLKKFKTSYTINNFSQRDELEDILRNLTPERSKVAEAMVFCVEHAESAEEICECIAESLSILETPMHKKVKECYFLFFLNIPQISVLKFFEGEGC